MSWVTTFWAVSLVKSNSFLIIGGLFLSAGVIVILVTGHLCFDKYFASVIEVAANYWLILIILILVISFSKRYGKT